MKKIGVLTSGGDAPGMNAAVRAVVRAGISAGAEVYAIYEGYQGMVDGQEWIRPMDWSDVGGILHKGGTLIGTARCDDFRERYGRLRAARNLLENGIDNLVIIGGDGSLTGANIFRQEWSSLLDELVESNQIPYDIAQAHRQLTIIGLVGSIDNDMWGTDISIGADTALHRITDAIDAISSTAASHQRSFVVEVMGRRCGYLALMSAIATGADWVLIPESPPNLDQWEDKMCSVLKNGRENGRRDSIVIVAEGAQDRSGREITCGYVKQVLEDRLQEDARVTILGHVQRGGSPSPFDRNLSTLMGAAAIDAIMSGQMSGEAYLIGLIGNKITHYPLDECLQKTKEVGEAIKNCDFDKAMELRGRGFREAFQTVRTLVRAMPHEPLPGQKKRRIAVINGGAPAPGMNTAVRAAVRLGLDKGHAMFGIYNGFAGFANNEITELNWMSVNGWAYLGGSELGTNRHIPANSDFYKIARNIEEHNIEGLLIIGGWSAYVAALELYQRRNNYPAFNIPIVCCPATIDNDLPGSELSVGADSALNSIIDSVDKIKQSAVASRRVFVVEVMGERCGYLALMSALATGAERVYLHEEGMRLNDLAKDVELLVSGFKAGKRLGVIIRSEGANDTYTTDFMCALLEEEGGDYFTVRKAVLGHMQQGGNPAPFDRIFATRLATKCITFLEEQIGQTEQESACIGLQNGAFKFTEFLDMMRLMDMENRRPRQQWWMQLRPIARTMSNGKAQAVNAEEMMV
ncbi:MAG: 6-phosphofructokinase [Anaerolineaceae bacterium]|nr:6-phosphofructokinase [Anaerolineaceae bacterium]